MRMQVPEKRPTREGLIGALIVCVLVSSTSLPILLPTLVIPDTHLAIRVGNFLLLACLFATGYGMAREVGGHPIRFGSIMAAIGLVLVGVAKALGG
jgi:VIT1/CCC1 family predicted Fe2+/Mn2+ transporter